MQWLSSIFSSLGYILVPVRLQWWSVQGRIKERVNRMADRAAGGWRRPEQQLQAAAAGEGAAGGAGAGELLKIAPKEKRSTVIIRWTLHFVLVGLILVALWWLNWWLRLEPMLQSNFGYLHAFWLPLLFLMLYVMFWLGSWLWQLTHPDRVSWDYPDINTAWGEAVDTLARAGIDMREVPLFLVIGEPEESMEHLFGSAALNLTITAPQGSDLALRLYAGEDRIFLTCPGASVLARQARFLAQSAAARRTDVTEVEAENLLTAEAAAGPFEPMSPSDGAAPAADPWAEEERRVIGLLEAEEQPEKGTARRPARSFLKNTAEVHLLTSRLHHVCRLLFRDRKPFCPINGILVLVPYAATTDDNTASQTATACRYDLTVIRQVLQVQCPTFALVCDLEKSEGFVQFVERLPGRQRITRLGQSFPLYPDLDEAEIPRAIEGGMVWLSDALLPSLVYNLLRLEAPGAGRGLPATVAESLESNTRLYRFLSQMRDSRKRLSRLLVRGLLLDVPGSYFFGGVYLAATGRQLATFVNGVLQKLSDNQNYVSWTPETLSAEHWYRVWSWVLFFLNLVLLIGGPLLVWLLWPW
jgi:hypothetical protein